MSLPQPQYASSFAAAGDSPDDPAERARRAVDILARVCGEHVSHADLGAAEALATHPDLNFVAAVAEVHGVVPLLALALKTAGVASAANDRIQQRAQEIALDNLRLSAELLQVLDALESNGIDALAYKGPALAQQLYGSVALRQSCDLDLLVAPSEVSRALAVLRQAGYTDRAPVRASLFTDFLQSQCEWQLVRNQTWIELHWAPFRRYFSFDFPVAELQRANVRVNVGGKPMAVPGPDDLFLLLCAHGAKHFWYRLTWLVDIAILLRDCADAAQHLLDVATAKGLRRIVLTAGALASRMLQVELPAIFRDAVQRDRAVPQLVAAMVESVYAGQPPADKLTENLLLLRSRERLSDRVRMTARLAFDPGQQEWSEVSLPPRLKWIYPVIRLARAMRYLPRLARRAFAR